MHRHVLGLMALTALILAAIFAIAPRATVVLNVVSGEVYGIDVAGFAGNADEAPQRYAKH